MEIKLDILNNQQLLDFRKLIDKSDRIVIACHKSPDGDALGASLALADYLHYLEKNVEIVVPDTYPDFLSWMPNSEKIICYEKNKEEAFSVINEAELIFLLDLNNYSRLSDLQEIVHGAHANKIMIDHHVFTKTDADLSKGIDLIISNPKLSSTCEIIFRIVWQLGEYSNLSKIFNILIYTGMMTDTGAFTYSCSNSEIFQIIYLIANTGIDREKIYRDVYNNFSENSLKLRGFVIHEKLNIISESHAAYFIITKDDLDRYKYTKGDTEGLVNVPLRIKNIRLSISLREDTKKENRIWVSMRTIPGFTCNQLASKYFNGGGHENASGGHLDCSLEQAEKITLQAIKEFETNYKSQ